MAKTLNKGTKITIDHPTVGKLDGVVQSATNWGTDTDPDWYIEYTCTSPARYAGSCYWKQKQDGGVLVLRS